ncbi:MAG TPA: peptidylprolyl isomerase [Vicinamibacteria bacterium]|jgi:peptidyl-prolyl cis-trans isomerase A (cyclophilin A)|nr:peptidylprolyl isomerase [Vicinamibacteria bacterium]
MIVAAAPLLLALLQAPTPEPTPRPLPDGPVVVLTTSMGRIKIGLHKDKAPITVDNFMKYIHSGHYDGTIFHRVMPNFMIQGGGLDPDMTERPTRPPIKNEARNGLRNSRGTLAMARLDDPNSATSQFFINVKDNHALDFGIRGAGYAVFGEVLEGMDVVDKIVNVPTTTKGIHENVPETPVVIKTAREVPAAAPVSPAPTSPKPASPSPVGSPKP